MKIFVSHSGKDNEIVDKIDVVFTRLEIEHWIDRSRIGEGIPVPSTIDEGFLNCTYFFLVWSKDAQDSDWVKKETNKVNYDNQIKRIPLLVNDTHESTLPLGFAGPYHRINIETVEFEIKKLINNIRADLDFPSQIKLFRELVSDHYKDLPKKPEYPVIKNFRKFNGYKYYVQQSYRDLFSNNAGERLGDYVLKLIRDRLVNLDAVTQIKRQIFLKQTKLTDLISTSEGKKYLALIGNSNDIFDIEIRVLTDLEVGQLALDKIKHRESLRYQLRRVKSRKRRYGDSLQSEIASMEEKISLTETQIANLGPEDGKKLKIAERTMQEIDKILKLNKEIRSQKAS